MKLISFVPTEESDSILFCIINIPVLTVLQTLLNHSLTYFLTFGSRICITFFFFFFLQENSSMTLHYLLSLGILVVVQKVALIIYFSHFDLSVEKQMGCVWMTPVLGAKDSLLGAGGGFLALKRSRMQGF